MKYKNIFIILVIALLTTSVHAGWFDHENDDHHHDDNYKHRYDKHKKNFRSHDKFIMKSFYRLDKNDDDKISLSEQLALTEKILKRMDDDKNGEINEDEKPKRRHRWAARALGITKDTSFPIKTETLIAKSKENFTQNDEDKDGFLSKEEYFRGKKKEMFKRIDVDGDGKISQEEFIKHQ